MKKDNEYLLFINLFLLRVNSRTLAPTLCPSCADRLLACSARRQEHYEEASTQGRQGKQEGEKAPHLLNISGQTTHVSVVRIA